MNQNIFFISLTIILCSFTLSFIEPPEQTIYTSDNNQYYLIVYPSKDEIKNNKDYETDLLEGRQNLNTQNCYAEYFNIQNQDTILLWRENLINPDAPGNALISNNGMRIVTFEDHYTRGFTDNDCVIYDEKGKIINRYNTSSLAKGSYTGSVSFFDWMKDYSFTDDTLTIIMNNYTSPSDYDSIKAINSVVKIELSNGMIVK